MSGEIIVAVVLVGFMVCSVVSTVLGIITLAIARRVTNELIDAQAEIADVHRKVEHLQQDLRSHLEMSLRPQTVEEMLDWEDSVIVVRGKEKLEQLLGRVSRVG